MPGGIICVNYEIPHPWHEVVTHLQIQLGICLVQVLLECLEAYRIAILMHPIVVSKLLKTIVRQVDVIVAIL